MIRFLLVAMLAAVPAAGCIEIQLLLRGVNGGGSDDNRPGDDDGQPGDGTDNGQPSVGLHLSNASPTPGEEVLLTCTLVDGSPRVVRYNFPSATPRLTVNHDTGQAHFIISESHVGVDFSFPFHATTQIR